MSRTGPFAKTSGHEPVAQVIDSYSYGDIRFEEVRVDGGSEMPWHDHPGTYIDLYLAGFAKTSWSPDVMAHTASVIPAGVSHCSLSRTDSHTFQIVLSTNAMDRFLGRNSVGMGAAVFEGSRPLHVAHQIFRSFGTRDALTEIDMECLLADFWAAVLRRAESSCDSRNTRWLRQVEDYLQDRYSETVSPDEVAAVVSVHPSHLMREFRRVHRCTIGDYVRALRIEQACRLLKSSAMSYAEVAHTVGFADQSHFNRNFKAQMGATPSEYVRAVGRNQRDE